MRVFLDMDGVLVDLLAGWLPYLNEKTGKNLTHDDVTFYGIEKVYGLPFDQIRKPLHEPGFWEGLPPYDGAIDFVEKLTNYGHDIYIATTPFSSSVCSWGKKMWIKKHLPQIPQDRVIMIHDKHLLCGDVMVDDKPQNIVCFTGLRILFDQPWNRALYRDGLVEHWFIRALGFDHVLQIMSTTNLKS